MMVSPKAICARTSNKTGIVVAEHDGDEEPVEDEILVGVAVAVAVEGTAMSRPGHIELPGRRVIGYKTLGRPWESMRAMLPLGLAVKGAQLRTSTSFWPGSKLVCDDGSVSVAVDPDPMLLQIEMTW